MTQDQDRNDGCQNTDRHLWPQVSEDAFAPRIFVTAGDGIGIDVGGHVIVKLLRDWHALAARPPLCASAQQPVATVEQVALLWSPEEMADLMDALARSADRHTNSYTETAHLCRNAAQTIRALAEQPAAMVERAISDEMVNSALNAWFASPPSETDQGLERSMRAALTAALAEQPHSEGSKPKS
jgi:hypothetical protein